MDCKTTRNLLEAYLDNELDRSTSRELETHADSCAGCSAELGRLDELRRALRDQNLRYTAPPELRERIRTAGAAEPHARASLPSWMRIAAACVLAFGAGAATVEWWQSPATLAAHEQMTRDLFASHWRALAAASPVDVISSDRHTVKPWFAGKVAQAPLVRDFADQGFALVGGRIDYVGQARVPVLVYKHGQHIIDVFVLPATAGLHAAQEEGYALSATILGDQPAAIVSDMDATERSRFEELLSAR